MTAPVPVRVMVYETWDEVALAVPPTTLVAEVKRQALARAGVSRPPEGYLIKYRGGAVAESDSLEAAGIVPDAPLIVLRRRRAPVR